MLDTIPVTSVHKNLEHGLVTLTESFSPLKSELHNLPCWSPKQKCVLSYVIPFYTMYTTTRSSWFDLVWASHSHFDWRDYEVPKALWNFPLCHTLFTDTDDMFLSVSLAARGLNLELLPCTVTGSWIDLDLRPEVMWRFHTGYITVHVFHYYNYTVW